MIGETRGQTAIYIGAWLGIISGIVILWAGLYFYAFDDNPPAVVDPVGGLDKDAYYPGERAILTATIIERKYAGVAALTVSWFCEGGRLRSDPPQESRIVSGSDVSFPVIVEVPITIRDDLPIGAECRRVATTTYKVNALAPERSVSITTEPFLVIAPPE